MTDEATLVQNTAADPKRSTWLSANAGSGKTRVLTDRVARLLLRGTRPQDILCLTYTKAAATEMQNRLFRTLGRWAMMSDGELIGALAQIGETDAVDIQQARTLFARAIETPGGLRIQTIHSFCAGLIRQFPVEAGVTPDFKELDANEASELLSSVVEQMAEEERPELLHFLDHHDGDAIGAMCVTIAGARSSFGSAPQLDDLSRRLGVEIDDDRDRIDGRLLSLIDGSWWTALRTAIAGTNATNDRIAADMAVDPERLSASDLGWIDARFANGTNDNSKAGRWPAKALRNGLGPWLDQIDTFLDGVIERRRARRALECRDRTYALHEFANVLLSGYEARKRQLGVLDFDDLIEKTAVLLGDETRAWVRYRLDSKIEHILVDEAQDTSPAQWNVISALADEIVSGEGAERPDRSIFVVGDRKQSIYSFQGADALAFDRMQAQFAHRMQDAPLPLAQHRLQHSFRSSPAILTAADAVLDHLAGQVRAEERHKAFFENLPGRVDVWPAVEPSDDPEDVHWYDPVDRPLEENASIRLADMVAGEIDRLIREETIPTPDGRSRAVEPGDILVLVQRRNVIFDRIIRSSQALGIDIAGPDRLRLMEEVAVKDILAFLRFLALPEDDLSLAEVLRSPVIGLSEEKLYDLAHGRQRSRLWRELVRRRADFQTEHAVLSDLLSRADYLRPFDMIERILIRHSGRERLLARLGPDAEDAIDELLSLALRFEESSVPDTTSFLGYLETLDADIKRAAEASGRKVRVMTAHGAKGLEAPIVILPDTIRVERADSSPLFFDADGVPFLKSPSQQEPDLQKDAKVTRAAAERAESERLLYVAMTRAETWLIVCGAKGKRAGGFWHDAVKDALAGRSDVIGIDTPVGAGLRLAHGTWPLREDRPDGFNVESDRAYGLYSALDHAARPPKPINPSDLGGEKSVGHGAFRENAKSWGTAVHLLLEHLPGVAPGDRLSVASRLLANAGIPNEIVDPIDAEAHVSRVIDAHPDLFTPDALREVQIAGRMGEDRVAGTVDLMLVGERVVRLIDFKTNITVPTTPEDVPDAILRQMGAYLHAIRIALPDHEPELAILWTENASLMTLPHAMVSDAFVATTTS